MTRVAAIDAGSNAIRFVVADFDSPTSYTVVRRIREPIRLGHGVFTRGGLDDDTMDRAAAAFRLFRREIDAHGVRHFRAVATSATREAENRDRFLARILAESDIKLEPISGREETRLVHLAVGSRVDLSRGRWILVDLGGGSVEVSLVDDTGILWSESHRVGTVRLLEPWPRPKGATTRCSPGCAASSGPLRFQPRRPAPGPPPSQRPEATSRQSPDSRSTASARASRPFCRSTAWMRSSTFSPR